MGWLNLIVGAMLAALGVALTVVLIVDGAELVHIGLVVILFGTGALTLLLRSPARTQLRGRRRP